MVGPSLEAIRKFKEQQERKKREELDRKVEEKLATLKHRASQGDRKAKQELSKIEKIKEARNKVSEVQQHFQSSPATHVVDERNQVKQSSKVIHDNSKKRARVETDFDELMKLARQNNNEIRTKPDLPKPPARLEVSKSRPKVVKSRSDLPKTSLETVKPRLEVPTVKQRPGSSSKERPEASKHRLPYSIETPNRTIRSTVCRPVLRYEDDDEDEEDYEDDDFVVNEEEDDVRDELTKTLKSVFRYDKRRCDLREEEIDRQYRAIGRVSTFEDLEREERRASRLAAAEDAKAFREEEERKKMKKLRLQNS